MAKFSEVIFIECVTDKVLVLKLVSKKCVRCAGGIGEVCNRLKDSENSCGVVDEDPTKTRPTYMENLLRNSLISNDHDIKVAYDGRRNNYLIALCPDLENWLIKTAKIIGIDVKNFGLPDNPKDLKMLNLRDPNKIEPFIDKLLEIDHPRIRELKKVFKLCKCVR